MNETEITVLVISFGLAALIGAVIGFLAVPRRRR